MLGQSQFPKRVLRARLFDLLQTTIDRFGGVGSGLFYEEQAKRSLTTAAEVKTPLCILGFLHFLGFLPLTPVEYIGNLMDAGHLEKARSLLGFAWAGNDTGVATLREQLPGVDKYEHTVRVPFSAWAQYFNIQRAVEIPAKVYNELKALVDKNGGIGAGSNFVEDAFNPQSGPRTPVCAWGFASILDGGNMWGKTRDLIIAALNRPGQVGGLAHRSDTAVRAINSRKGITDPNARVTFDEWAAELNIIPVIKLPAKYYDALKRGAARQGGIGAGSFLTFSPTSERGVPNCAAAILADETGTPPFPGSYVDPWPAVQALGQYFGGSVTGISDRAVMAIREATGKDTNDRVSFEEWAQYLNVDRVVEVPAATFDAVQASAEKHGGIGARENFDDGSIFGTAQPDAKPFCALGHTLTLDGGRFGEHSNVLDAALDHALTEVNDRAVQAINQRKGTPANTRVSFAEWTQELSIVRGDA